MAREAPPAVIPANATQPPGSHARTRRGRRGQRSLRQQSIATCPAGAGHSRSDRLGTAASGLLFDQPRPGVPRSVLWLALCYCRQDLQLFAGGHSSVIPRPELTLVDGSSGGLPHDREEHRSRDWLAPLVRLAERVGTPPHTAA